MSLPENAVVRINSKHSFELYGTPEVLDVQEPGKVRLSIGRMLPEAGGPLVLETGSLEWLIDLAAVAMEAYGRGVVQAGMKFTEATP